MKRRSFLKLATLACGVCLVEKKLILPNEQSERPLGNQIVRMEQISIHPGQRDCTGLDTDRLASSISQFGLMQYPIGVWRGENLLLLDGVYRLHALKRLGWIYAPVNVVDWTNEQANNFIHHDSYVTLPQNKGHKKHGSRND